ncbi:MAG: cation:proton antiporter, partial [Hyphomicrobium sp.]|nr:cation:proton antiporter [Hyphomicrobium sp.]
MTTAETSDYVDVVLFLATAGIVVPLFRQWKLSPILGFLAAGVLLGPSGLGALQDMVPWLGYLTIKNAKSVAQLADLGVVFLLFSIGLELSWERLKSLRRLVFGLGGLQVAICTGVIAAVAIALRQDVIAAALLGMSLALSSTAIVMPLLAEQKRQYTPAGRATFAILLLQDLAVAPLLVTIAFLGNRMGEGFSPRLLLAFAPAAAGMVALVVLGRLALRPMMAMVAKAK